MDECVSESCDFAHSQMRFMSKLHIVTTSFVLLTTYAIDLEGNTNKCQLGWFVTTYSNFTHIFLQLYTYMWCLLWPMTGKWGRKMTPRIGGHIPWLTADWLAGYFLRRRRMMMLGVSAPWYNEISMVVICSSSACLLAFSQVRKRWKGPLAFI